MSDFVRDAIKRVAIVAAFVCCAVMAAALLREATVGNRLAHDYSVYWRAANQPAAMAYDQHYKPFPYAPTMLLWIAPLGFVSSLVGYLAVTFAGIAALYFATRAYLSRWEMILTLFSAPMIRCIRNGQISAILAAALIWACQTPNRIGAGLALGSIASIKPQLVIMAPLMLVLNRDWRAFWAAGVAFLVLALASLLFGTNRWAEWLASMSHFHTVLVDNDVLNIGVSPAAVAEHYGLPALPFLIAGAIVGAALAYLCRDMGSLEKATAIGAGSILAAPYALAYDLVIIMPFIAMQVMRGKLSSFLAIAALGNPAPLLIAAYHLVPRWNIDRRRLPFS
jgi:hypothetical protein